MEVVFALLLLWVIVIVIGHGSYVLIRALWRGMFNNPRVLKPAQTQSSDLAATRRVILNLAERDLLTPEETAKLHDSLIELNRPAAPKPIVAKPIIAEPIAAETIAAETNVTVSQPELPTAAMVGLAGPVGPADVPVVAELVTVEEAQPLAPTISKAEIVRSFLAANNIRWGELVAGMLIVICSIGLVISLWNTITEHRFVPSMIFLSANAAIYAAGFYTLSRWRLRHTSRAVLAIATLLVPLTVLAGIAAADNGPDAVQLTDPLTLLAIGLAAPVYGFLLFRGGNALARRPYALPIALAVAGPVAAIPLIPAALRNYGPHAGWFVGIGSIAVVVSLSLTVRMRRINAQPLGTVAGRSRLLVIAFAAFSTLIAVGYAGFALRESGQAALMPIALATIPAVVALAATGRSLASDARKGSQALAGSVLCVLLVGLACLVLPPATSSVAWLWSWGLVLTGSLAAATWLFREPRWLALATVPTGIAATLSSPLWLGNQTWTEIGFWNHCIGGEPMLAAACVSLFVAILCGLIPQEIMRRWLGYATALWASVSLAIAVTLTIASEPYLGAMPSWTVTAVLSVGTLVAGALAKRHRNFSIATVVTATFAAASVFRPLEWSAGIQFAPPLVWIHTLLATSAVLLFLSELVDQPKRFMSIELKSDKRWNDSACVAALIAAVISCAIASEQWTSSATMLVTDCGLLLWSATRSRSILPMLVCQSATVALAVVIGYGLYHDALFSADSWRTGLAPFAWAICVTCVVAMWLGLRQLASFKEFSQSGRLRHLKPVTIPIDQSPVGFASLVGTAMLAIGAAWSHAALVSGVVGGEAVIYQASWQLPCIEFLAAALTIAALRWQESKFCDGVNQDFSSALASVTSIGFVIWTVSYLASLIPDRPQVQLVVATTAALIITMIASRSTVVAARVGWFTQAQPVFPRLAAILIGLSSGVLIYSDWSEPAFSGELADRFSTLSVAGWWLFGSVALVWKSKPNRQAAGAMGSALLAPAAAILIVPAFYQVHPFVWFQVAALVSTAWFALAYWLMNREQLEASTLAIDCSRSSLLIMGIGSAAFALLHSLFGVRWLESTLSLPGACLSLVAVLYWCIAGLKTQRSDGQGLLRLPAQTGTALLAGQIGWLAAQLGIASEIQVVEITAALLLATSIASLWRHEQNRIATVHVTVVSMSLLYVDRVFGAGSELIPWLALAGVSASGCLIGLAAEVPGRSIIRRIADRGLGWFVIGAGCYLLIEWFGLLYAAEVVWTSCLAWTGLWIVLWRLLSLDRPGVGSQGAVTSRFRSLPDSEFAVLLGVTAVAEAIAATFWWNAGVTVVLGGPLLIARLLTWFLVACSAICRPNGVLVWNSSLANLLGIVSLVSVHLAIQQEASPDQRFVWALLPAGFTIALLAQWISPFAHLLARVTHRSAATIGTRLASATWTSAVILATLTACAATMLILNQSAPAQIQMMIVSIALSAWAVAAIADTIDQPRLRHLAVMMALTTIGFWASVIPVGTTHPVLIASMRWLVAAVFAIPMLLFVLPYTFGTDLANHWRSAFRQGAILSGMVAGVALVAMLVQEAYLRSATGIDGISLPMVIGVAVVLSILSALAALIAIASRPTSSWRERLSLTDSQRVILIYAAQTIGTITWLHIFLCKTDWAFVGLRGYWPYVVMSLAFLSVGLTEWARRSGDRVLAETIKKTALYLPLIPIVGFWFGVSSGEFDWLFEQGRVRYDVLLAVGAVYYLAISAVWKEVAPRIAAIVLGNAAWWIVLVQQPGWGFVSHPQAWMIPPAVCVLGAVHLYRHRLGPSVSAAIRYAATLVIYISSTADMLLQQIGQNISGPIILVMLALCGMVAGIVLRVRPFLFLGATFVFIGVTSMVWHAQTAIGQVWPWWVFGITTGICLLGGLMALEKSKPRLKKYANELSTWQG